MTDVPRGTSALRAISLWWEFLFSIGPDDRILWPVRAWKIARSVYPPAGVEPLTEQEIHDKFFQREK